MRIYEMTATFGKLERSTLTLKPGLNVIEAPNEWGKSTWCAFLLAMLYGVDTRERSRQGVLADKERYAPWSGSPMSGRMDINWKGRDITLERSTRGSRVFGLFRAYETATGIAVPELTAENCGTVLLGAERSVYARAGFIRQWDMPVAGDEALRRRLNALVTTGDESGEAEELAQKLKNLKNRCRHNKTGLLPQAEAERDRLREKLRGLQQLQEQEKELRLRQEELTESLRALENHRNALEYERSQRDSQRLSEANAVAAAALERYETLQSRCAAFGDKETVQQQVMHLEQLQLQQQALLEKTLPAAPVMPEMPEIFKGLSPMQALVQAKADKERYDKKTVSVKPLWWVLTVLLLGAAGVLFFVEWKLALTPCVLGVLLLALCVRKNLLGKKERAALLRRYPGICPEMWIATAEKWQNEVGAYEQEYARWLQECSSHRDSREALEENIEVSTGGASVAEALDYWRQGLLLYETMDSAYEQYLQAKNHAATVEALVKTAAKPEFPDTLRLTESETEQKLEAHREELRHLRLLAGQCSGRMEAMGDPATLQNALEREEKRIAELEDIYTATCLAMDTLQQAATELQRKFAPRIASRARALFSGLTQGRYQELFLNEDLSLMVSAQEENNLRPSLWRSDGTVDQLYLALRLAVAEALMGNAPLVLDDALVRFDDTRAALALDILKQQAEERQVLLFTCQSRENRIINQ